MKKLTTLPNVTDPYTKRILTNVLGKDALKVCAKTPGALKRLTKGLTEAQLRKPPAKGRWPIAFIVNHLCDAELAVGYRLRMTVAQPGRKLQAYDESKWAKRLYYHRMPFSQKMELFTALRLSNVSLVKALKPGEWKNFGIHEERGKETVERMVQMLAGHDLNHLRQVGGIRKILTKTGRR